MQRLEEILTGIRGLKALVVGDVCLDRWCQYAPSLAEASRETGIPRTAVVASECTPGAAGTVANNLAALGAGSVAVLGVLGDDGHGFELRKALSARGIGHTGCIPSERFCTFTYTKLLNQTSGEEDLPRVDFVNVSPLPEWEEAELVRRLRPAVESADVVLVSDQAETQAGGVVTGAVRDRIAELARAYPEKVFWVDSRLRPELFRDVIVKPNEDEARAALDRLALPHEFHRLRKMTRAPFLVVTQGSAGAQVSTPAVDALVPTVSVLNPVDICGAGDSFSAGAALAYGVTRDPFVAAYFGNLVASITIMKKGTGTASPDEVRQAAARQHG